MLHVGRELLRKKAPLNWIKTSQRRVELSTNNFCCHIHGFCMFSKTLPTPSSVFLTDNKTKWEIHNPFYIVFQVFLKVATYKNL